MRRDMSSGTGWNCQVIKRCEASMAKIPVNLSIEDAINAARVGSLVDGLRIGASLLNHHYEIATTLVAGAVNDIKKHWIATADTATYFHRAKVVDKLMAYYLISVAIYIIEMCFRTNGKMIRGVANLIVDSRDNTRMSIGLCIAALFVLCVYLLGAEDEEGSLSASRVSSN